VNPCEKIFPKSAKVEKLRRVIGEPDKMFISYFGDILYIVLLDI